MKLRLTRVMLVICVLLVGSFLLTGCVQSERTVAGRAVDAGQSQQANQQATQPVRTAQNAPPANQQAAQQRGTAQNAPSPSGPRTHAIQITEQGFNPSQVTTRTGDTVVWTNARNIKVRVIGGTECPQISSPLLSTGESFTWTFSAVDRCPILVGTGISGESCNDNSHCSNGRSCIDKTCKFISELYNTAGCQTKCNIQRVQLITSHKDLPNVRAEGYILSLGRGSYTGAGALAWTLAHVPDYCSTNTVNVPVPIEISRLQDGEVIGEEIISLKPSQEKTLTHPAFNLHSFTIRVIQVDHTCGQSSYG